MTELQKEYCKEKGLIFIKPENTQIADYVNWLEAQIQALHIHDVVGRSEQLKDFRKWWNKYNEGVCTTITHKDIERYLESL